MKMESEFVIIESWLLLSSMVGERENDMVNNEEDLETFIS